MRDSIDELIAESKRLREELIRTASRLEAFYTALIQESMRSAGEEGEHNT